MRNMIWLVLVILVGVSACAYPVITAGRAGYSKEEHAIWEAAAKAGNVDAQYEFGWAHCCGDHALFDNRVATKWMCAAARQEHHKAQMTIADLYNGSGNVFDFELPGHEGAIKRLPPNDKLSLAWYIVASRDGDAQAVESRDIFRKMAFDDVVAAIDMARKYPEMPCEIE